MLGVLLEGKALKEYQEYDSEFGDKYYGLDILYVEPDYLVGRTLADCSEYLEESKYSIAELSGIAQGMTNKLEEKGLSTDVKLYVGTRPS